MTRRSAAATAPISRRRLLVTAAALALGTPALARARSASVLAQPPSAEPEADGLYVSTSVVFALPRPLEDALMHGVPLYFRTQLTLSRPRWWWMDETVAELQQLTRLAYLPLLEKYRVSTGALQRSLGSLDEAIYLIQHQLHQKLADTHQLGAGQSYVIGGNFELDLSQLPKPFQLNVGSQSDWQLQADFPRVSITWNPPGSPG